MENTLILEVHAYLSGIRTVVEPGGENYTTKLMTRLLGALEKTKMEHEQIKNEYNELYAKLHTERS